MNYIPTPDFIAYAQARGQLFTTEAAEVALTKAMDFLVLLPWKGTKTDPAQALDWPRTGVPGVADDVIPVQVIDAQCRLAMLSKKMDLMPSTPGGAQLIEKRMDGVGTFKYAEGTDANMPAFPWLVRLLDGLVGATTPSGLNFSVRRG